MTDFSATKALFHLPKGVIYLDGNSLGALPVAAAGRARSVIEDEWGGMLIRAWNQAGWMEQPQRVGDRIAPLIGAASGTVMMGDTLSVKMYQALASALEMRPGRKVVLSDSGNFPTDLYMAAGLLRSLGQGHRLKVVDPEDVAEAIHEDVAVLLLTHVDYRTGRMHDMAGLTDQKSLDRFWLDPALPLAELRYAFFRLLAASVQVRGNFCSKAGARAAAARIAERLLSGTVNLPGAYMDKAPRQKPEKVHIP